MCLCEFICIVCADGLEVVGGCELPDLGVGSHTQGSQMSGSTEPSLQPLVDFLRQSLLSPLLALELTK